jgi:hypothetical protein
MRINLISVRSMPSFIRDGSEVHLAAEEVENRRYALVSVVSVEVWQVRFVDVVQIAHNDGLLLVSMFRYALEHCRSR